MREICSESENLPESSKPAAARSSDLRMWLSCHTQEEIAEAAQCDQSVASDVIRKFMGPIPETQNHKAESEDVTDFEIPLIGIGGHLDQRSGVRAKNHQ